MTADDTLVAPAESDDASSDAVISGEPSDLESEEEDEAAPPSELPFGLTLSVIGFVSILVGLVQLAAGPTGGRWWVVVVSYIGATVCLVAARRRILRVEGWAVLDAGVHLLAAVAALFVATRQHLLWESLIALIVAVITAAVSTKLLDDIAARHRLHRHLVGWPALAVLGSGAAAAVWGMADGNRLLAFEGFVVTGVGMGAATRWARGYCSGNLRVIGIASFGLLQASVLLQGVSGLNVALGAGLVLWVASITVLKLGIRTWVGVHPQRAFRATIVSLVALGAGVVATVFGGAGNAFLLIGGASMAVAGLSGFGIAVVRTESPRQVVQIMTVTGFLAVLVGVWLMRDATRVIGVALLVGLILMLTGVWFVLRGEGLVALMLMTLVVLWGMGEHTAAVANDPNPTAGGRILALGDSFISGEGADDYLPSTNAVGGSRNECRRAPTAYPYLVAVDLELGLDFYACSGATSLQLLSEAQMPDSPDSVAGALPQLGNLAALTPSQIDAFEVVLVSIGGNDVGFSTIVKACLLPRDCDERSADWFANVKLLGPQLVTTYQAIKAAVPNTPVLVMPYPEVTGERACGLGLQNTEHRFVVEFIRRLNNEISRSAATAGVGVFDEGIFAFGDHGLCSEEPATNHLDLGPPEGHWLSRYSPGAWVHGSMHPNELGHRLTADALVPEVDRLRTEAAALQAEARAELVQVLTAGSVVRADGSVLEVTDGETADVVVARMTVAEVASALGRDLSGNPEPVAPPEYAGDVSAAVVDNAEDAKAALTDNEWISNELFRTVWALLAPAVLLLAGAILATAGLVMWKPRFGKALPTIQS